MAVTDIVAADVRNRLGVDSIDVTDAQCTQFIAFADGWEGKILAINSKTVATMESYESAIMKQAKIDKAAQMALTPIVLDSESFDAGPIKIKSLSEKAMKDLYDALDDSIDKALDTLGWVSITLTTRTIGGNDYTPGGDEGTMIDFGESDSTNPFRTMT